MRHLQLVADAAGSFQLDGALYALQAPAGEINIIVQVAVFYLGVRPPDPGEYRLPGDGLPRVAEKEFQQVAFPCGEGAGEVFAMQFFLFRIISQIPARQRLATFPFWGTPQDAAYPCEQFLKIKGFHQIIICAAVQPGNLVV